MTRELNEKMLRYVHTHKLRDIKELISLGANWGWDSYSIVTLAIKRNDISLMRYIISLGFDKKMYDGHFISLARRIGSKKMQYLMSDNYSENMYNCFKKDSIRGLKEMKRCDINIMADAFIMEALVNGSKKIINYYVKRMSDYKKSRWSYAFMLRGCSYGNREYFDMLSRYGVNTQSLAEGIGSIMLCAAIRECLQNCFRFGNHKWLLCLLNDFDDDVVKNTCLPYLQKRFELANSWEMKITLLDLGITGTLNKDETIGALKYGHYVNTSDDILYEVFSFIDPKYSDRIGDKRIRKILEWKSERGMRIKRYPGDVIIIFDV